VRADLDRSVDGLANAVGVIESFSAGQFGDFIHR